VYRNISKSSIVRTSSDGVYQPYDTHGVSIADLDRDGTLDMLHAVGGGRGRGELTIRFDNVLLWGENPLEGGALRVVGGPEEAVAAGLNARGARGRFNYLLDVDGDGLIDVFTMSDRGVDNPIRAQELRMNQGGRTWKTDPNMREFARTAILTDADGDGYAEELVFQRTQCFPRRDGPGVDPALPEMGEFPAEYILFCESHPPLSTAIYQYSAGTESMQLVSPSYAESIEIENIRRKCPFNAWLGSCNQATSSASGDFDGDLKADLEVLYPDRLVLYYSTRRATGELPLHGVGGVT
jgi:hypothetical protein